MTGLLIDGALRPVEGLTIIQPASHGGPAWAKLDLGDYRARPTPWIRQVVIHTTKGIYPQPILPGGGGPGGADKIVADFWRRDPVHSAAQLVVDTDGSVVCLADLARVMAYHAEGSNAWSVGIEMYQIAGGGITEATLDASVMLVQALCAEFGIPEQMPDRYLGEPLSRMEVGAGAARHNLGGPNCVGVFGHRHNTGRRGRGDPGDEIFRRLDAAGFEALDYDASEDLEVGRARQLALNALDARAGNTHRPLVVDGVCGPASLAAMRRLGFSRWRDVA